MSASRIFNMVAMIFIVIVICLAALPKNLSDAVACRVYSTPNCNPLKANKDSIDKPAKVSNTLAANSNADIATIAKMTIEGIDGKYASLKESQDRLFSVITALGALMTFLGFKGFDSFFKSKEAADLAVQKAEEVSQFLEKQYGIDNRAEYMVIEAATLRNEADLYAEITKKTLGDAFYEDLLARAKERIDDAITLDSKNLDVHFRALGVLGNIYYRLKDFKAARDCSEKLIKLAEKNGKLLELAAIDAHYNYACYSSKLAEKTHADGQLDKALEYGKAALSKIENYLNFELCQTDVLDQEADFDFLRVHMKMEFETIRSSTKKSTT